MDELTVGPGPLTLAFRPEPVMVTPHMLAALERMRAALLVVAMRGDTITYGELAVATGGAYFVRNFGRALDVLTQDCLHRDEPSLAALVVTKGSGEVGSAFTGDAAAERAAVHRYWSQA